MGPMTPSPGLVPNLILEVRPDLDCRESRGASGGDCIEGVGASVGKDDDTDVVKSVPR